MKDKIPYESWTSEKTDASHFKVFGCVAYAHILEEKWKNIYERSVKYIFIGYSEKYKAYRLYNHVTKNFIISKDVKFQGDKWWDDKIVGSYVPIMQTNDQVVSIE